MIQLTETQIGIGIPYPSVFREDRPSNYGYMDLKRFPSLINNIPELQHHRELFDLVRTLNRPDSLFRTLGCNSEIDKTYVHVAFEVLHWNTSKSCYRRLISDYEAWLAREWNENSPLTTEFRICPASYWDHHFDGWAMSIHFETKQGSLATLAQSFTDLGRFFESTSSKLQTQLRGCQNTISAW